MRGYALSRLTYTRGCSPALLAARPRRRNQRYARARGYPYVPYRMLASARVGDFAWLAARDAAPGAPMARKLLFREVCPGGEQIHIKDTVLRGPSRTAAHTHDFCEFFLVRSGTVRHHVNGESVEMASGSLCVAGPNDEHCYQAGGSSGAAVFTNIAVAPDLPDRLGTVFPNRALQRESARPPMLTAVPSWFTTKLDTLWSDLDKGRMPVERQRLLAATLLADVLTLLADSGPRRPPENEALPPWLRRALNLIEEPDNYTAGLHRFLELCGKSQEYVSRTTRRYLNRTPTELVNAVRLREAARLLRDTDDAVLAVVLRTGFNNVSHFLVQFKKAYGCTPREYRRRNTMVIDPAPVSAG
ncbi:MAG: helix-turn-helix domain-containing protein [Chitinivibrionales bacterium]|nr:helix-turn-helix domain-containing protein [Chitinivibrionales bacterium]